jgi:hypothetical protein
MKTKKYKIFSLDYLQNEEFSEEDLIYLFETPSLNYSLIVGMFELYEKTNLTNDKIINIITSDEKWMYKHFWNKTQRNEFIEILKKCYYNIYRYNSEICQAMSDLWIVQFGFTSAKQKKKKMMLLSD